MVGSYPLPLAVAVAVDAAVAADGRAQRGIDLKYLIEPRDVEDLQDVRVRQYDPGATGPSARAAPWSPGRR